MTGNTVPCATRIEYKKVTEAQTQTQKKFVLTTSLPKQLCSVTIVCELCAWFFNTGHINPLICDIFEFIVFGIPKSKQTRHVM